MSESSKNNSMPLSKPVRVYIDGCYDFTHFGHYNALRQARALGDELVVGIHSDVEVEKQKRPSVYPENERYRLVGAVKWVSEVVEDVPYRCDLKVLDKHNCDFCVHGDDPISLEDGTDCFQVAKDAGRYKEFKRTVGISTTDLINRIIERTKQVRLSAGQSHSQNSLSPGSHEPELPVDAKQSHESNNHHPVVCEGNGLSDFPYLHSPSTSGMPHIPNVFQLAQFAGLGASPLFEPSPTGVREPQPGETVVYAPGTFDLFHYGHLCFIEQCQQLGSYLIIGLYNESDSHHESLPLGTIMTLQERLLCVLSFRGVANVLIGAPYKITEAMVDHFKIDVVAVGRKHSGKRTLDGSDPFQVARQLGILRIIDSGSSVTTARVVERVLQHETKYAKLNEAKEARECLLASSQRMVNHRL